MAKVFTGQPEPVRKAVEFVKFHIDTYGSRCEVQDVYEKLFNDICKGCFLPTNRCDCQEQMLGL